MQFSKRKGYILVLALIVSCLIFVWFLRLNLDPANSSSSQKGCSKLTSQTTAGLTGGLGTIDKIPAVNKPKLKGKFAYVTYATDNSYACCSLILAASINNTNIDPSIDIVVMYTNGVAANYIEKMLKLGVKPVKVDVQRTSGRADPTWIYSMTKLLAFNLVEYDRLIFLDGDSIVLKNLDHLFALPRYFLYSPRAYWLPQPFFNAQFLVLEPNIQRLECLIQKQAEETKKTGKVLYDMDVLNFLFKDTVALLPPQYMILNSVFSSSPNSESVVTDMNIETLARETFAVHFSEAPYGKYGKPWKLKDRNSLQQPLDAHPLYHDLFQYFWKMQDSLCS